MVASPRDARARWLAIAFTLMALTPAIVVVVTRWGDHWVPVADFAVIDLRARDVWGADVPLVGPYSRYGWNHPGPWLFWALGAFSRAGDGHAWITLVGHAALQGSFTIWLAVLTWKTGGLRLVVVALSVLGLTYGGLHAGVLLEPWNPHVVVPLFVLFLFQSWLASRGDLHRLPGLAVSSTLLVQAHVGYVVIVGAALSTVAMVLAVDRRCGRFDVSGWKEPARRSLLALALLWAAPLVDEVARWPDGNGRLLFDHLALGGGEDPAVGLADAARIVAGTFRIVPPFIGATEPIDPITSAVVPSSLWWWAAASGVGIIGWIAVARTRRGDDLRLLLLPTALLPVAVVAVARVTGPAAAYIYLWRVPIVVLFVVAAAIATARWWGVLDRPTGRVVLGSVLAALASAAFLGVAVDVARHPDEVRDTEDEAAALLAQLDEEERPDGPTIVRYAGSALPGLHAAVLNELDRQGRPMRVDPGQGWQWGDGREADPSTVDEVWYVVEDGQYRDLLTALPGAEVIADLSPFDDRVEDELEQLDRVVASQLVAADRPDMVAAMSSDLFAFTVGDIPGVDLEAAGRIGELNAELLASNGCRCAIVRFPAAVAPPVGVAELPPVSG